MRTIVVSNIASLDGYFEGPHHGVMDLPMDQAFDAYNLERFRSADTVLLGKTSYRGFNSYWPSVQHHPQLPADDPMARAFDDVNRAISRRYDEVDVVVVSDSLEVDPGAPWADRTRVLRRDQVATFKESGDGECVIFGSHLMWNGLLQHGLVDEIHIMQGAVVLGGGTPLFTEPASLQLKDTRTFHGSDNVVLVYRQRK